MMGIGSCDYEGQEVSHSDVHKLETEEIQCKSEVSRAKRAHDISGCLRLKAGEAGWGLGGEQ